MEVYLHTVGHVISLVVEAIALFLVAVGTVEALINIVRIVSNPRSSNQQRRAVWLDFAQWLVAAIRTFLSYFLDREVENTRKVQREREAERAA